MKNSIKKIQVVAIFLAILSFAIISCENEEVVNTDQIENVEAIKKVNCIKLKANTRYWCEQTNDKKRCETHKDKMRRYCGCR